MISKNSPEFACGQLLYNLKMSQLNYFLQETPYSVFITVRKKFKRNGEGHSEASDNIEKVNKDITEKEQHEKIQCIEKENKDLKQSVKDTKCDIGRL